jgi:hypothetical protein
VTDKVAPISHPAAPISHPAAPISHPVAPISHPAASGMVAVGFLRVFLALHLKAGRQPPSITVVMPFLGWTCGLEWNAMQCKSLDMQE